ncbi:hypothetical protein FISHEDRAFT_45129 [Fistulina hepatica ATCC 64428]|uniref:BTB domain-containing protein n=1 Tax=Fistulina hepatica ATCC 64428 TaxID=1128425 RepID=A0A0D7AAP0_9AGAR|nr:hypothetical protein FISHEDRAFT_45129 [Fistulina hepatica ATCC 64428]
MRAKCHNEFWFEDGSIVLLVEDVLFRVHRTTLARHSQVFATTFCLPQPADEPSFDGCPLINLPSDSNLHWQYLLTVLYDPFYFGTLLDKVASKDTHFPLADVLAGLLRLSDKYAFTAVRQKTVQVLRRLIPTSCEDYTQLPTSHPRPQDIDLFREANTPEFLPYCLFSASCLPEEDIRAHPHLSPDDKELCLLGKERLQESQKTSLSSIYDFSPSPRCRYSPNCKALMFDCAKIKGDVHALVSLKDVHRRQPQDFWACPSCLSHTFQVNELGMQQVWDKLPAIFSLGSWSQLRREQAYDFD